MNRWTLRDHGCELAVEVSADGDRNHAVLLLDGTPVDSGEAGALESTVLRADERTVAVDFWWGGRPRGVHLLENPDGTALRADQETKRRRGLVRVPFTPPPGTRAARRHAWREAHPRLWAARHVAIEAGSIVVGLLGISALIGLLFGRLLPSIDWSWLPDLSVPHWLRYVDPVHWISRVLPDVDWFGWVPDLPDLPGLGWVKYVVTLLIAAGIGVREVRRRRERDTREQGPAGSTETVDRDDETPPSP